MKYSLEAFNPFQFPPPRRYVPMFLLSTSAYSLLSNDAPIILPGRRYGCLSPLSRSCRLDQCSLLAMICWTLSRLSTLSCIRIHPFFFVSLCIVLLPSSLLTMFPPPLYLPRFIPSALLLPAFVNVFFNTFQSLSRASHYIGLLSLSLIFFLFSLK